MPKKAKKGGEGTDGGRTEEERLTHLQQRAQAEEEMAKKKEEILTLFLKDKLQKEEKNTAVNLLKLNEGWRSILRQTREAELREDVALLSQTFERQLDGLDSIIKNLQRDLQEAEHQSAQVRRLHLQHMERLWAQQDKQLMLVQQQWESSLQHLSSRFNSERKQMFAHSQQQRADLGDATFAVEQQHKAVMAEIHRLYSESIASYQSAYESRKDVLVVDDKAKLREKMFQKREAVQLCRKETKKLEHLLCQQQQLNRSLDSQVRAASRLQEAVIKLRTQLNSGRTEDHSVAKDLTATDDQAKRRTLKLQDQLTRARTAARKQLSDLSVQSDGAVKKLQAVIAKGERVLRVAEMCRKLEGEQKKVLPSFPAEGPRQETAPETQEAAKTSELRHVTRRLTAAELQREALRKHKDDLRRENQQLRLLLRQHLDAMTVSGPALDGSHLLTVQQAPTTAAPPGAGRHHTVIEAVHAIKPSL